MAEMSKTALRSSGVKGTGVKADKRAFVQEALGRKDGSGGVTVYNVWRFAHGDKTKQSRITMAYDLESAKRQASRKGYDIVNPKGDREPIRELYRAQMREELKEVEARIKELTDAIELNDTITDPKKKLSDERLARFGFELAGLLKTKADYDAAING